MARKKPAKKARKKTAAKKSAKKTMKKSARPAARKAAKKKAAKKAKQAAPKKKAAKKTAARKASAAKAPARQVAAKKPNLDRPRKTVADIHGIPSSLDMGGRASAAKSGRAEMKERLSKVTSSSPALTSGDIDADWESAESVGDEAPGGDNPTPDQDVVDDIGRALGVEYDDDEELQGGAEISDRDRHRWELDPSSKDDFDDEE
jgi:hypothetical protein